MNFETELCITHLESNLSILTLNSYSLLFDKCKKEVAELQECTLYPNYDFILFNVILSINHLFEWYLKDDSVPENQKVECIKSFNPYKKIESVSWDFKDKYKALDEFPKRNKYQEIIRELCNKAKHFKKEKSIEIQDKNFNVEFDDDSMECGNAEAVSGGFDHYIYFVEIDDNKINIESLVKSLINQWSLFIDKWKIVDIYGHSL